jgi:RHS repeat-associated protein
MGEGKSRGCDLSNQLIRVSQGATQVGEYTYNGAGQRIKKVTQTETRIFHYDLWGHLIAEANQSGQMVAEYVYLGDQLLAMIKPGEAVYYFHNDHLGTPQVLTDDSQGIAWKAVYTPFGEAVPSIQTVENPFRFPGQYYDQETGLHYNYFRYYNPQTGRYITPDPIGLEGGINLFAYTENNPLIWSDSWGLLTEVIITHGTSYGHAALRINNMVYSVRMLDPNAATSFGMRGDKLLEVFNFEKYLDIFKKKQRDSTGYVINLSATEEKAVRKYLDDLIKTGTKNKSGYLWPKQYFFLSDNCATTVVEGLQSGLGWFNDFWIESIAPYQLEGHLKTAPWLVNKVNYYPWKKTK